MKNITSTLVMLMMTAIMSMLIFSTSFAATGADTYIIHAGSVLAVPGSSGVATKQTILIKNDMIIAIKKGYLKPESLGMPSNSEVVDWRNHFVLPGLIDMHTHLNGSPETLSKERADFTQEKLPFFYENGMNNLLAGFTTVRDLGDGSHGGVIALKKKIDSGELDGPRIFSSQKFIGWPGNERIGFFDCNGPAECRALVRKMVTDGSTVIKIKVSSVEAKPRLAFHDDELEAIVSTAHMLGLRVAAHAHEDPSIEAAIRAGVDSIEHAGGMSQKTAEVLAQSGIYMVPTLTVAKYYDVRELGHLANDMTAEELKAIPDKIRNYIYGSFEKAAKAGVRFALGTDVGSVPHGINAEEFELMVRLGRPFGFSEEDAIKSSTVNAADLLGMSDQIGTLEAGKKADLIAVSGNPLQNIRVLENVHFVVKGGKLFVPDH